MAVARDTYNRRSLGPTLNTTVNMMRIAGETTDESLNLNWPHMIDAVRGELMERHGLEAIGSV